MLSDERIRALAGKFCGTENNKVTFSLTALSAFARAIAEEVLGKQEPIAWRTWEDNGNGLSYWTFKDDEQKLDDSDWEALYASPQPCPKCAEWENKFLMEQAVQAGDGVLLSENELLKTKCAELEAELAIYREREKTMGWNQN